MCLWFVSRAEKAEIGLSRSVNSRLCALWHLVDNANHGKEKEITNSYNSGTLHPQTYFLNHSDVPKIDKMLPKAALKFNIYALFFVAGFLDAKIQTWVRFHICDTVLKTGISTFVFRSGLSRKILLVFTGFQTFKVTEIVKKKKRGLEWFWMSHCQFWKVNMQVWSDVWGGWFPLP